MIKHKSNLKNVELALTKAEEKALESVGIFVRGESQARSPVGVYPKGSGRVGGNLRDSNDYKMEKTTVIVGNNAEYSIYVHEGTFRQKPQKFLEDAVMQNGSKIKSIVERQLRL